MILLNRHRWMLISLALVLIVIGIVHLFSGPISLRFDDFSNALFNYDSSNVMHSVVREIRIPRMCMAIISGAGLSVAGLLMQTLFRNPLAGPYVLGINSGASLFVAFSLMTGIPFLTSDIGLISHALLGAFLFGLLILLFSKIARSQVTLLLTGIMLGSFTSAIISLLESMSDAQELKQFTMWALGSLQRTNFDQLPVIVLVFLLGFIGALLLIRPLNLLVLGEKQAELLGINFNRVRLLIILVTAVLTGLITAYCGPIAFVGLAVPNLVRMLMKTQHHGILLLASALGGSLFVLLSDLCIQLMELHWVIPINVFTSIVGAPIVVVLLLKRVR